MPREQEVRGGRDADAALRGMRDAAVQPEHVRGRACVRGGRRHVPERVPSPAVGLRRRHSCARRLPWAMHRYRMSF